MLVGLGNVDYKLQHFMFDKTRENPTVYICIYNIELELA